MLCHELNRTRITHTHGYQKTGSCCEISQLFRSSSLCVVPCSCDLSPLELPSVQWLAIKPVYLIRVSSVHRRRAKYPYKDVFICLVDGLHNASAPALKISYIVWLKKVRIGITHVNFLTTSKCIAILVGRFSKIPRHLPKLHLMRLFNGPE